MPLVLGPVFDPLRQDRNLFRRQRFVRLDRRHPVFFVRGRDPIDQFTRGRIARHDRIVPGPVRELSQCCFRRIEPQPGSKPFLVRAVALETILGQDRPDVPVVVDRGGQTAQALSAVAAGRRHRDQQRKS